MLIILSSKVIFTVGKYPGLTLIPMKLCKNFKVISEILIPTAVIGVFHAIKFYTDNADPPRQCGLVKTIHATAEFNFQLFYLLIL